jgi:aspartyl-tRNA(Asn)/glutamyl-tRNA(Gln) amidotransferase subunit A
MKEFHGIFKKFDAMATPTNATLPVKLWARKRDEPTMIGVALPTRAVANLTGMPALSVPCGFYRHLPIGLQLVAPHYREDLLFRMAYTYEQKTAIAKSQFSSSAS